MYRQLSEFERGRILGLRKAGMNELNEIRSGIRSFSVTSQAMTWRKAPTLILHGGVMVWSATVIEIRSPSIFRKKHERTALH